MSEKLNSHEYFGETEDRDSAHEQIIKPEDNETSHKQEKAEFKEVERSEVISEKSEKLLQAINAPSNESEDIEHPVGTELKSATLNNNLSVVRANLSKSSKKFSQFVHRPIVNSLSEVTAKTLIRPTAILCGGLFTLVGSGYYLYATNETGFKYNFFSAISLFIGGFVAGLILEFVFRVVGRSNR